MARDRRGQLDAWLDVELVLPRVDGLDVRSATLGEDAAACAGSRLAPDALAPGMQLGKYRLVRVLGAGGMGVVWEARDVDLDRAVALKVLVPELDGNDVARSRLVREARALARVHHPNVITIFDASTIDGRDVIAMELIVGETLASWLARRPPRGAIVAAILAAGRGLAVAHAAGMIHRDFKPYNVLIDLRGRVVVTDFGLARAVGDAPPALDSGADPRPLGRLDSPLTAPGAVIGTPAYMAPEQFDGDPADARADQFALCVTAWEALTGQRPFAGVITDQLAAAIATARPAAADRVPRRLRAVLQRGLAPDPAARWPSVDALLDALTRAWQRPARIALAVAATALVALSAGGMLLLRHVPWQPRTIDLPAFEENGDSPAISPDGTQIAYVSDRERKDAFRLYVAALPDGEPRAITPAGDTFQTPRWTRDGTALLVVRWDPASYSFRIVRQPLDGGPFTDLGPGIHVDDCGDAIAIVDQGRSTTQLVLRHPDGRRQVLVPAGTTAISVPRCDRDGQRIAFTRGPASDQNPADDIVVVDRTGAQIALTRDHVNTGGTFTPDGSVVFTAMRDGQIELFEVPATGGEPRQLTFAEGPHFGADVSRDGRTLAFNLDDSAIVVVAGAGGEAHRLTTRREILAGAVPTRDGRYVIAQRVRDHGNEVIAISTRDGSERTLTRGRNPFPSLDDRRVLFAGPDEPLRLLAISIDGGAVTEITRLPGKLAYGADGPDGTELMLSREGAYEAWRVTHDGRLEPRGVAGFVVPAPGGGWRAVVTFDTPNHLRFVAPGDPLTAGTHEVVPESDRPMWLDDHRIAYAAHGAFHVVDVTTGAEVATLPGPEWGQKAVLASDGVHWYDIQLFGHVTRHLIVNFADRPWR
jgi:serine/threonine protein kinase/Tol biopolymer transport system component